MKKFFLLTIEDWNEDSPDDNAWVEHITSNLDGGSIDVKCEVYNASLQMERDALREALDKIDAVTKHLMLTDGYKDESEWLGAFIYTIQDVARAVLNQDVK